jgi:hypothetical protein
VGCDVFPVQVNHTRLVVSRGLERRSEFLNPIEIVAQKRRNLLVVNRQQCGHSGLNSRLEYYLPGAFFLWHGIASIAGLVKSLHRETEGARMSLDNHRKERAVSTGSSLRLCL